MKKIFAALILACAIALPAVSQTGSSGSTTPVWDHGDNVSEYTYRNLRVYRVFDYKTAYVVLYEKGGVNVGSVTIPKKWYTPSSADRKLEFRNLPGKLAPYMTIIYKNDEFYKVWLNLPMARTDGSVWGTLPTYTDVPNTDADTLIIEY